MLEQFPVSYTWSELMLNYQGGFIKRGLLGEIAYQLQPIIAAPYFLTAIVVLAYLAVLYAAVIVFDLPSRLSGLLLLLGPAGFLFPLNDIETFGRKDVFILVALMASMVLVGSAMTAWRKMTGLMLIYLVAGAIVETAILYFPIAFLALTLRSDTNRQVLLLGVAAVLFFLTSLAVFQLSGAGADLEMTRASWLLHYPNLPDAAHGALCCVQLAAAQALSIAASVVRDPGVRNGYVIGGTLALAPIAILVSDRPFRLSWLKLGVLIAAVIGAAVPFAVAADWGRYIHLAVIHLFMVAWARREHSGTLKLSSVVIRTLLILLYATTWVLWHWSINGVSPFRPGLLF